MKIAFYLENENIPSVDLSTPFKGNPGCGGTQYLFVALPYFLKQNYPELDVIIYANHIDKLPFEIPSKKVKNVNEAFILSEKNKFDYFIYRPRRNSEHKLLKLFSKSSLNIIAWLHITPKTNYLRSLAKLKSVKAIIPVEEEQKDRMIDSPCDFKTKFIVNGYVVPNMVSNQDMLENKILTYIGALTPQKGFHKVAEIWPKINKKNPEAKLLIIGSDKLYNEKNKSNYVEQCKILLSKANENSYEFLGKLGVEKERIFLKTAVGIVNPTGESENCPGSALDFQAYGIPVVSGAFYGMLDTIIHKKTGLLARNNAQLIKSIEILFNNKQLRSNLGHNGRKFIKTRYDFSKVSNEWYKLFEDIKNNNFSPPIRIKKNIFRHYKLLIVFNIFIKKILVFDFLRLNWPSTYEMREKLSEFFKR